MQCQNFRKRYDDWRQSGAASPVDEVMQAHLAQCPACRQWTAESAAIRAALARMPAPPLPAGLRGGALAVVRRHATSRRAGGSWRALAATLAMLGLAGILTLAGTTYLSSGPGFDTDEVVYESRTVRLSLSAGRDMQDVEFVIELPEGVEIDGYPGQRVVRWQDQLAAGSNALSLPLLVRPGEVTGEVVTRIEHEGRTRELRVPLAAALS